MNMALASQRVARLFWAVLTGGLLGGSGVALAGLLESRQGPSVPLWDACLMMMRRLWDPSSPGASDVSLAALPAMLLIASGAWAGWRSLTAWWHTRQLWRHSVPYDRGTCPALDGATSTLPVPSRRLRLLDTPHPVACTVGFWRPQVVLSTGLIAALSGGELRAVLGHEWGHVSRRDPLRLFLLRFWSQALWFLPIVSALARDRARRMEVVADDAAVGLTEQPLDLAAALVKTARARAHLQETPISALGGEHAVTERVERLLGQTSTPPRQRHYRAWATSLVVTFALLGVLLLARHPGATAISLPPHPIQPVMMCPMAGMAG